MTKKITKAVIPAAGLGTRFLPATKAVPKELLPIVDKPTIQYIVEEVAAAGIDTVVLVVGRGKDSIVDHFDNLPELEEKLLREGKEELAAALQKVRSLVQVVTIRQGSPRGLGHAVLCARQIVRDEPFVVLLGDDLVDAEVPCTRQMADVYEKYGRSVVALMEVGEEDVSKFGICGGKEIAPYMLELDKMIEKPKLNDAPSRLAIVGRYVLTPDIFPILERTAAGSGGEIQLTDAMSQLMKKQGFIGYRFSGKRFDAGDKFGFLTANIAYAMKRPGLKSKLLNYMRTLLDENQ
jgi:UTP--glucose-1-phosphate uridylyltransferase